MGLKSIYKLLGIR